MEKIVIASGNADKVKEIKSAFKSLPWELTDLSSFSNLPEAVEDGQTFAENAEKKARHYQKLTGMPCLADDSGLMVEALGGAPGVHSARFAGYHADDGTNNAKLVGELRRRGLERSSAKYVCALALVDETGKLTVTAGEMSGEVRTVPQGEGGFGYDPYFYLPDGRTLAQISRDEKNSFSHRGKALRALAAKIERSKIMDYKPETDIEKILVTEADIKNHVERLGREISAAYANTDADLVCVGMLNGASIFFADLVRRIETCPIVFDFMRASSYGNGTVSGENVVIEQDLSVDVGGKHLLLIEDIVDSGLTMHHILHYLKRKNPASIKICALLSKPSRRRVEVPIDYLGQEVPDEFLIGYGMDYAKKYRNLPYVGVLKREVYADK